MMIGLTLDPNIMFQMWRMLGRLDGLTPFHSSLSHPFSEKASQTLVSPVVQANREYYSQQGTGTQVGAAVATSAFQTAVMLPSGLVDLAGGAITKKPSTFIQGFFADTLNMVFSIGTRAAKMTTQGIEGDSAFDKTLAVADLTTEVVLAAEGINGAAAGLDGLGARLSVISENAKVFAKKLDQFLPPQAVAALADGGIMMAAMDESGSAVVSSNLAASGGNVIDAEIDRGAAVRKEALDEALQIPAAGLRATALTGTLDLLATAGDWDDFVYAASHSLDAIAEVGDKKSALALRQDLAGELARLMPDDVKLAPSAKVRGQLKALVARELPEAGRNAQLMRFLQSVQDKLAGWERVARERTPDTPLPQTLKHVAQDIELSAAQEIASNPKSFLWNLTAKAVGLAGASTALYYFYKAVQWFADWAATHPNVGGGGGGWGCFTLSMQLRREDGSTTTFGELAIMAAAGQTLPKIASIDEATGQIFYQAPVKVIDHGEMATALMQGTGELHGLEVTPNHPLYVEQENGQLVWKHAGEIGGTDALLNSEGQELAPSALSAHMVNGVFHLFDLTMPVAGHNFLVKSPQADTWLIAHNKL